MTSKLLAAAILTVAFASFAPAQTTYDPVDYFMLTPGLWRIEEDRTPGQQPSNNKRAIVVAQLGKYTVHHEFSGQGQSWFPQGTDYFEITPTALLYHGDYNPLTNDFQLFNPPLRLPRSMKVGDVVQQKVISQTPQGSAPVSFTFALTADGITKKVKSGTYNGCLRFAHSFLSDEVTETAIEIRARTAGYIWSLESELDSSEPEVTMASSQIGERAQ